MQFSKTLLVAALTLLVEATPVAETSEVSAAIDKRNVNWWIKATDSRQTSEFLFSKIKTNQGGLLCIR